MTSVRFPRRLGARPTRSAEGHPNSAPGFTLLELAVVIFIMALMFTLAVPYTGGYRKARLKSEARRLAGQ